MLVSISPSAPVRKLSVYQLSNSGDRNTQVSSKAMSIYMLSNSSASINQCLETLILPWISLCRHWSTSLWQYWTSDFSCLSSSKSDLYATLRSFKRQICRYSSSLMMMSPSSFSMAPETSIKILINTSNTFSGLSPSQTLSLSFRSKMINFHLASIHFWFCTVDLASQICISLLLGTKNFWERTKTCRNKRRTQKFWAWWRDKFKVTFVFSQNPINFTAFFFFKALKCFCPVWRSAVRKKQTISNHKYYIITILIKKIAGNHFAVSTNSSIIENMKSECHFQSHFIQLLTSQWGFTGCHSDLTWAWQELLVWALHQLSCWEFQHLPVYPPSHQMVSVSAAH